MARSRKSKSSKKGREYHVTAPGGSHAEVIAKNPSAAIKKAFGGELGTFKVKGYSVKEGKVVTLSIHMKKGGRGGSRSSKSSKSRKSKKSRKSRKSRK